MAHRAENPQEVQGQDDADAARVAERPHGLCDRSSRWTGRRRRCGGPDSGSHWDAEARAEAVMGTRLPVGMVGRRTPSRRMGLSLVGVAAVCYVMALSTQPARGDSSVSTIPLAVSGMASSEGKSKTLLNTLESLFKKNCELLSKLRVELNDFSDGLESLRELADSKLKGAFAAGGDTGDAAAAEPQEEPGEAASPDSPQEEMPGEPAELERQPSKNEHKVVERQPSSDHDPLLDRQGLRTTNTNSEGGVRGDQPIPLQLKDIRRTISMDDIVLTEDDEQDTKPMDEVVCFLDLDKCTIYGQDGNDLAIAMQWMGRSERSVVNLYRCLMNPQIKPLIKQLHRSTKETPVVLYTMRPQLLQYRSAARNSRVNLRWKNTWHHSPDQVVIPPDVCTPDQILNEYAGLTPLMDGEKQDLFMSFQRLLAIRTVVAEELELDYKPHVVVTSTMKDVEMTARKLGLRPQHAYLWDDNKVLEGQPHVLTVAPYVAMDLECRERLYSFLAEELPADELREEVVDFMLGAKPEQRCVRMKEGGGGIEYFVNEAGEIPRFPIPELPVCYSRPRFTGADGETHQTKASVRERFNSNIVEFWSAAWRKMDSDQLAARQQWKDKLEMVW